MERLVYAGMLVFVLACAALIAITAGDMPAVVASHFGPGGVGNGMMPRLDYLALMLGLAVGMPLVVACVLAVAPRVTPLLLSVPNAALWLTGVHKADAQRSLAMRGALLAVMLAAFITAVHLLVVAANRVTPPVLDGRRFVTVLATFLIATGVWAVALMLRFRRPPGP